MQAVSGGSTGRESPSLSLLLKIAARFDPREPRSAVNIASSIVTPDDRVVRAQIYNLSRMGFMAEITEELAPGILGRG